MNNSTCCNDLPFIQFYSCDQNEQIQWNGTADFNWWPLRTSFVLLAKTDYFYYPKQNWNVPHTTQHNFHFGRTKILAPQRKAENVKEFKQTNNIHMTEAVRLLPTSSVDPLKETKSYWKIIWRRFLNGISFPSPLQTFHEILAKIVCSRGEPPRCGKASRKEILFRGSAFLLPSNMSFGQKHWVAGFLALKVPIRTGLGSRSGCFRMLLLLRDDAQGTRLSKIRFTFYRISHNGKQISTKWPQSQFANNRNQSGVWFIGAVLSFVAGILRFRCDCLG